MTRMSKDYRHCRGGLPDLVVWNTSQNTYKVRKHHILAVLISCIPLCMDYHFAVPDYFISDYMD